jgi:hypothetical protein
VNSAGYYSYRDPEKKTQKGLGKDRAKAIQAATGGERGARHP